MLEHELKLNGSLVMYVLRIEGTVAEGSARQFEEQQARVGELLKKHPGFARGALLNSTYYPAEYVRMLRFVSRESARAWLSGSELSAFLERQPLAGAFSPTRPPEAYELVEAVRGDGQALGRFVHMADWTISTDPATTAKYEADRKELFQLRRDTGTGFVAMLLLRFVGGQGRYVMYSVSDDEASHAQTVSVPTTRKWVQEHPAAGYGSPGPIQETYDLVQAYVP